MISSASEALVARYDTHEQVHSTLSHVTQSPYVVDGALSQCTLKKSARISGVSLNSQKDVAIALHPAPPSTGIVFRRVDLPSVVKIRATPNILEATASQMNLKQGKVTIHNTSHLMSAFAGLGIDNAFVDLYNDQIPYMDGSADAFSFLLQMVGAQAQPVALKRFIRIKKPLHIGDNMAWIRLNPFDGCQLAYQAPESPLYQFMLSPRMYMKELTRARHTVLTDTIQTLRYPNEVQRHHLLDVMGDLYILGANLIGAISCYQPTHTLTQQLMHTLLASPDSWEYVEFRDSEQAPQSYQYLNTQTAHVRLKQS